MGLKLIPGMSGDEYWIEQPLLMILETLTRIPIICLHHEIWSFKRHRPRLINSARAGKLSFFTLGEHVNTLVKEENLEPWSHDGEDEGFDWSGVPAEVYVPVSAITFRQINPLKRFTLDISPSRIDFTSLARSTCKSNHPERRGHYRKRESPRVAKVYGVLGGPHECHPR
jgi:hypothetical protein